MKAVVTIAWVVVGLLVLHTARAHERVSPAGRWTVEDIANDGRTLTLSRVEPSCIGRRGPALVHETTTSVRVTLTDRPDRFELRLLPTDPVVCVTILLFGHEQVTLSRPLGRRRLVGGDLGLPNRRFHPQPAAARCMRVARAPRDAPLRETRWGAEWIAACAEPLPESLLDSAAMRGPRVSLDAAARRRGPIASAFVLRYEDSRRLIDPFSGILVPGPRYSCVFRKRHRTVCDRSPAIARRFSPSA